MVNASSIVNNNVSISFLFASYVAISAWDKPRLEAATDPEKFGAGTLVSPNKLRICDVSSLLSVVFTATVGIFIGFAPPALRELILAESEAAAPTDNPALANDNKNVGSPYLFYENRDGFNFKSILSMYLIIS